MSSCCTSRNTSGEHQEASRTVFLLSSLTLQKDWVPCLSAKPTPAKGFLFAYLPKSLNQNSPRFQHWIWSQMSKIICLSVIVFLYSRRISSKWDFTLCLLYPHVPGSFPRTDQDAAASWYDTYCSWKCHAIGAESHSSSSPSVFVFMSLTHLLTERHVKLLLLNTLIFLSLPDPSVEALFSVQAL